MAIGCAERTDSGDVAIVADAASELRLESGESVGSVLVSSAELSTAERLTVWVSGPGELGPIRLADALPEGMEIVGERRIESDTDDSVRITEFTIEPFLPGSFELGAVSADLQRGDESLVAMSDPIPLTVVSVFGTEEQPDLASVKSIVDPGAEPIAWWLVGAVAGGALLVLCAGGYILYRVTRAKEQQPEYRHAHAVALERLRTLEGMALADRGEVERLHVEASLVLRRYIEDRFGLHAPERTTDEFLREAKVSPQLGSEEVIVLEMFLRQCDMVKFAGLRPGRDDSRTLTQTVRNFIERTKSDDALVEIRDGVVVGRASRTEVEFGRSTLEPGGAHA